MALDLSALQRALVKLGRAIDRATGAPDDEELRDAVIQRFEYSHELSWKMLKRHIEEVAADRAAIDRLSYKELVREAFERGLLTVVEAWIEYRHQRNLTSHTYDEAKAQAVFESATHFYRDALALLVELEKRNAD